MVIDEKVRLNAQDLELELDWFARVLDTRFKLYFDETCDHQDIAEVEPPDLREGTSDYASFLRHYQLTFPERLAVVLSLVPHVRPQLLDIFFMRNKTFDRKFTEFGGAKQGAETDFLPSAETLAFLLGGVDLGIRFSVMGLFDPHHFFARHNILRLTPVGPDEPLLKAPLRLSDECLSMLTTGRVSRPEFGANFPAQLIETQLTWNDLVLHPATRLQIEEISTWIQHGDTLMNDWGMASKLRPGYRSLFHGPPGTGKTMTACLLGKSTGRDVYKIELSQIVSKYIGETEKNLARVFDQAQHKGWILFFDEADALFGKRSQTKDAHDRYANQEVSYLLQRIETFDGIAILSSNFKENLDTAFTRRFESIIYFPIPRPEDRLRIWRQGFSSKAQLEESIDLEQLARDHVLSGGSVMNVIRFVSLQSLKQGGRVIGHDDLMQGIRREYSKEGKTG
jgi:ATPase family associated with various cellular activities (AAA)